MPHPHHRRFASVSMSYMTASVNNIMLKINTYICVGMFVRLFWFELRSTSLLVPPSVLLGWSYLAAVIYIPEPVMVFSASVSETVKITLQQLHPMPHAIRMHCTFSAYSFWNEVGRRTFRTKETCGQNVAAASRRDYVGVTPHNVCHADDQSIRSCRTTSKAAYWSNTH